MTFTSINCGLRLNMSIIFVHHLEESKKINTNIKFCIKSKKSSLIYVIIQCNLRTCCFCYFFTEKLKLPWFRQLRILLRILCCLSLLKIFSGIVIIGNTSKYRKKHKKPCLLTKRFKIFVKNRN